MSSFVFSYFFLSCWMRAYVSECSVLSCTMVRKQRGAIRESTPTLQQRAPSFASRGHVYVVMRALLRMECLNAGFIRRDIGRSCARMAWLARGRYASLLIRNRSSDSLAVFCHHQQGYLQLLNCRQMQELRWKPWQANRRLLMP